MKRILLLSIVAFVSVAAQRGRIRVFGVDSDYGGTVCAPVTKCPSPCRLGKETTGCALCVCRTYSSVVAFFRTSVPLELPLGFHRFAVE